MNMKLNYLLIFALLTAVAILCSACGGSGQSDIRASGEIESRETAISSLGAGQLADISVEEGETVLPGDTLVLIDRKSNEIALRQANAGVDAADAQLDLMLTGARSEDIARAREAVNSAKAALNVAEADARRAENLFAAKSITAKRRDDAIAAHTIAKAQYNSALEALATVSNIARPQEIKLAQAKYDQAVAARDLVQKSYDDCTVLAPTAGTITQIPVEAGELVTMGSVVAVISNLDTVDLVIYATEVELGHLSLGQAAKVSIDAYPGRDFDGVVTFISPEAEFTPKNIQTREDRVKLVFAVKIRIPNPDHVLKPGLPADAILRAGVVN